MTGIPPKPKGKPRGSQIGLRPFKPGNKGGGRPKGLICANDVKLAISKLWKMTKVELYDVVNDKKSTMGELMVASIMARTIKDGDASRLSSLLDRAIGRVKHAPDDVSLQPYAFVINRIDGPGIELGLQQNGSNEPA